MTRRNLLAGMFAVDAVIGWGREAYQKKVRTTCNYCGVGCQFDFNIKGGKITRVTSTPEAPRAAREPAEDLVRGAASRLTFEEGSEAFPT